MTTVAILLAAGASRRFGEADKLLAPFRGRALIGHAAQAVRQCGADACLAVVTSDAVAAQLEGFDFVRPPEAPPAQSDSLRAGIAAAQLRGATRVLVALGDMPFVDAAILKAVLARATADSASAVTDGARRAPPACFPMSQFSALLHVNGDRGASGLIRALAPSALVSVPDAVLIDIDTPLTLAQYATCP